jgi:hypothetical protein
METTIDHMIKKKEEDAEKELGEMNLGSNRAMLE